MRLAKFFDLARDERGVAAVELGLIASTLSIMLLGVVDVSTMVQRRMKYQEVATEVGNIAQATTISSGSLASIKTLAATLSGLAESNVTTGLYSRCDNGALQAYTATCSSGIKSSLLQIVLNGSYTPQFTSLGLGSTVSISVTREIQIG